MEQVQSVKIERYKPSISDYRDLLDEKRRSRRTRSDLATRGWRKISDKVVRSAGGVCQMCGVKDKKLVADHVNEIKLGGNPNGRLQAICYSCNAKKSFEARKSEEIKMKRNRRKRK